MPINPGDIMSVAVELSESSNEAKIRASIGRSYYSAYHHGLKHLSMTNTNDVVGGNGGTHNKLQDLLKIDNKAAAAYVLADLKAKRVLADYDLTHSFSQEDAEAAITIFNRFLEKLN